MPRPSLWTHRKFARLSRLVGAQYRAVGVLEMVWRMGHDCGDPVVGTADDVEFAVGWDGEAGRCASALVESGFLDLRDDGQLAIHDMGDHAPEYVANRAQRERERRIAKVCSRCGTEYRSSDPRSTFCSGKCRTAAWREGECDGLRDGHGDGHERTCNVTVTECDGTPAPAPAPAPSLQESAESPSLQDPTSVQESAALQGGRAPGGDAPPALELEEEPQARTKGHRKKTLAPDGEELRRLTAHYHDEFRRTQGTAPVVPNRAVPVKAFRALLRGRTYDEAAAIVTEGLEHPDAWVKSRGLLRPQDLAQHATGIVLRLRSKAGPVRAPDGTVARSGPRREEYRDEIARDEAGVLRFVRLVVDAATGAELSRRWGEAIEEPESTEVARERQ